MQELPLRYRNLVGITAIIASLIFSSIGIAQGYEVDLKGKVTSVLDGDTLKVTSGSTVKKIRFVGVDAPEIDSGRSTATDATNFVKQHCLNKNVIVDVNDPRPKDSSGRTLGLVYCNGESKSMDQQTLEQDYAVRWIKYACDKVYNEFWNSTFYHCS